MFDQELWSIETEPTKIAFAGDWHRNGSWAAEMIKHAREQGADTIVQAGDFGFDFSHNYMRTVRHAAHEHSVTVYFVDGNHDNHNLVWKGWDKTEAGFMQPHFGNYKERVNYIPRGHRWSWWGLTFMGVGGAASVDRQWREPGISWWHTEMVTEGDILRATKDGPVDVMIAHDLFEEAPFPNDRKDSGWPAEALHYAKQNRLAMQGIVDVAKPKWYIHGHYHERYQWPFEGIQIVGLGMDATTPENNMWIVRKEDLVR